jgi:signal transduction histidine kinase/CheY-like chemotaxis protein
VIEDIVHVSQGLAEGTQSVMPQAEYQGDFAQDWLKTGQAQLNNLVSGEQENVTLAKNIISFLTTYIEAQVGLFYLLKESQSPNNPKPSLQRIASYAYTANDNIPEAFLLGEGLVGQVALDKKPLSRTHTPEEYTHIVQSGLAQAVPRYVLLLPFLYENVVKGVIEIGASKVLTDTQQNFLEQVMPSIGIAVNTTESRAKMQELLEQSQLQTEELQSQSEELQSQQEEMQQINEALQHQREELQHQQEDLQQRNEELQSQAEELQSQSEELQTQQEELKQTNEALEERSKELELQKDDVQQKNVALEKTQADMKKTQVALETKAQQLELASQYKSEFLANMSHELRTPLNSLLILAQLLAENKAGNLTDKQVEYAQTINSSGSDLLKLINDILDLSKVEAGKMEVSADDVSLSELMETIEQKFRPVALDKGLAFHIQVANDLPAVLQTDAQRLQQILNNLLSNAFKFTENGEIQLTLRYVHHEEVSPLIFDIAQTIAISVTDTGIGIPEAKQQLIFEAFQQVDGTTSRRFGGTGLGLSISSQLAMLLGGEIQLQSEEGRGSTFTLYLPEKLSSEVQPFKNFSLDVQETKVLGDSQTDEPLTTLTSGETVTQTALAPEKPTEDIIDDRADLTPEDKSLLIIEDDRKFSSLLMELAQEKDFKCLIAEDGKTGLQLAEQYKPHAVILDVGLPQLDGWTVMERLKDNPDTRHIPVHFISATDQNSQEAKKMGAIGYLHKPVNLEQLGEAFKQIEQFLSKTVKTLLVIVDSEPHQQQILELVGGGNIQTTLAVTTAAALQHLKKAAFDCIILDMDIEQSSGLQLLEQMQEEEGFCQIPLIVYAERELTPSEEASLLECADHLTLKTVRSKERLLDEATLFLHQLEANLSKDKRNILRMVHDKEAILTNKKVMIVDDDIRNTFALTTFLEDKNMEVVVGNNGKEALELLNEHPDIAVVLMDIMMPEMDGYEAMRQIRAQERFRKQPIIALTAKAMKGDKGKCIEAGANDYLSKPVDTDKLISLMRVWLYR